MKKYNFVCVQTIFNDRMDTKKLRQKILDLAIHGKLVPQNPNDEPASVLLERIRAEKERLIAEGKIKRSKKSATSDTSHYENVPFEVPEGWEWVSLSEIAHSCLGKMLDKAKNQGTLQPYLRNVNVRWGTFELEDLLQMPFVEEEDERFSVVQGDLVVCEGGEPGRCAIWENNESIKFQKALHRIRCFNGALNYYIKIVIEWYASSKNIELYYTGSTIKHLTGEALNTLQIPLPPIQEQHHIVSIVDQWMSLIDMFDTESSELKQNIEKAKSKILDLAIHGKLVPQDPNDEPASELLKRINPKFTPCDNAHYENVPSNWALARVEDIGQLLSGRDLTKDEYNSENIGLPYLIGASNIEGNTFSFIRWTEKPQVISQIGDILISCKGTIGAIVKNNIGDIHIARQFMAIRPNTDGITSDYLHICMIAVVEEIKKDARGVIPGIARDDILTKVFAIPPINEQRRIIAAINQYHSILDNISANL